MGTQCSSQRGGRDLLHIQRGQGGSPTSVALPPVLEAETPSSECPPILQWGYEFTLLDSKLKCLPPPKYNERKAWFGLGYALLAVFSNH